jgi:hypothetical protein
MTAANIVQSPAPQDVETISRVEIRERLESIEQTLQVLREIRPA